MDPVDLSRLDALAEWMRTHGATRVVLDGARLEVDLGAAPPGAPEPVRELTAEERQAEVAREKEQTDRNLGLIE